ncbi:MAG TPA: hypothetical protein VGP33_13915, partial [Chloroflexota bacterium]|nr:hypothetical protein [Chloroflexota bacterium]
MLYAWSLLGLLIAVFISPSSAAVIATMSTRSLPPGDITQSGVAIPAPIAASPPVDPLKGFRNAHPEAIWPHWFADNRLAWATVGLAGGGTEGLVALDGTFSPNRNSLGVSLWLRDDQTGTLYVPQLDQVTQSLGDGDLPLISTRWSVTGATLTTTIFAASDAADPTAPASPASRRVLVQTTLTNGTAPRRWTLYVTLRPFGPAGGTSPLHSVTASSATLSADGALILVAQTPASRVGALNESAIDASVAAKSGSIPAQQTARSSIGLAEGMLAYDRPFGHDQAITYNFVLPMQPAAATPTTVAALQHVDVSALRRAVSAAWQARLHHVQFAVGDPRVSNAFYASLAYLFMAQQGDEQFSGPLSERAFWLRDAAYVTNALDVAGYSAQVKQMLRLMASTQFPSGRYPPIIDTQGQPQLPVKTEWDTQGEVIYALVSYAQQNHDLAFLQAVYPGIWRAARFQQAQLAATRVPALRSTPYFGILPAGESAEDLYSANWHHYWDDFWALAGFDNAGQAAQMLGFANDVPQLTQARNALQQAIIAGVKALAKPGQPAIIPNGPEDTTSTAMARSATPAMWPLETLDPNSQLVQSSFQQYYDTAVKPYDGAYLHYNYHYWPYADASLAHAFYRLGRMNQTTQILNWVLSHQTAPNLYAWAEIVRPDNFSFALGDMPHSWMAAEMILLIRDMLVREDGQAIAIGPMPENWLPAGGKVSVRDFPTALGDQSYRVTRSADGATLQLTFIGSAPPGGYRFQVAAD